MRADILHVLPDFAAGGAEHIALHLLRQTERYATAAVCLGPPLGTALEAELAQARIPVRFLGKSRGFQPRYWGELRAAIRGSHARILHTHRHVMPYVLPELLARRDLRCVHTVHNLADREAEGATRWAQRAAFRLGAVPVAIAEVVRAGLQSLYSLGDVVVIPNGIPPARYAVDAVARRAAREGYPADAVVYACVARLSAQKDHATLLDAFARALGREPRAHLLLAGEGPLHGELARRANALHLSRVRFAGVQDVRPVLAAADVVVLSSRWEGSPLALMEAMAAERAVVATRVGGVPELIEHERNGLLVPPGDADALALALKRLFGDAALRAELARAGHRHAREHCDSARMARRYEALYARLLARRSSLAA